MNILFIDASAGVSGDMLLAGFFNLGLPRESLLQLLRPLGLSGVKLNEDRIHREGLEVSRVSIRPGKGLKKIPRTAGDLLAFIHSSGLSDPMKRAMARVVATLARAEGQVHHRLWQKTVLHQLGQVDTLVDLAGFLAGITYFRIGAVYSSAIPLGCRFQDPHGQFRARVGPATQRLLVGFPVVRRKERFEWTTPTGAALLAAFGTPHPPVPFRVKGIGFGVGSLCPPQGSTVLRFLLGEPV